MVLPISELGWGVSVAVVLLCLVAALLGFLHLAINRPPPEPDDSLEQSWHRLRRGQ